MAPRGFTSNPGDAQTDSKAVTHGDNDIEMPDADDPGQTGIRKSESSTSLSRLSGPTALCQNNNSDFKSASQAAASNDSDWVDVPTHTTRPLSRSNTVRNHKSQRRSAQALAAIGIQPDEKALVSSLQGDDSDAQPSPFERVQGRRKRRRIGSLPSHIPPPALFRSKSFALAPLDFFGSLARCPEILMELAKQLPVPALVSLYAISRDFHETLNGHMSHIMKACAKAQAPEAALIFRFTFYRALCIHDPVGRPHPVVPNAVRMVPSPRWLAMVVFREKTVRDILACMAREGHRMPKDMSLTLKKMWLTMDISTTKRRAQLMHNERFWTDQDLWNAQMFMLKLDMRFNDPVDGPADDGLRRLILGQRSLSALCKLLKREAYLSVMEITQAALRYAYMPQPQHRGMSVFGVRPEELGRGHLEGWGQGRVHLMRVDELVMREACRRNLGLDEHMLQMLLWGYVDPVTRQNITVTDEEMYMSDDEVPRGEVEEDCEEDEEFDGNDEEDVAQSDEGEGWTTDDEDDDEDRE